MKVAIFEEEYKNLLDIKTRVDVAVEQIIHNEYIQTEEVLRILGTKEAVRHADALRDTDRRRMEEYAERQQEMKEEQQDDKHYAGG